MANAPRKRVLVVLDDDAWAARLHRVIERAGFRPFLARNAAEAHELLERQLDPCVLLFSLTSSDEGRQFLGLHGASSSSGKIPVIFFPGGARMAGDADAPIVSALLAFVQTYCASAQDEDGSSALH
jgi:ActR/RegA family two-component response regulator